MDNRLLIFSFHNLLHIYQGEAQTAERAEDLVAAINLDPPSTLERPWEGVYHMFGLQPTHWLVIAIVALLFFAPSRLPELGQALRQTMKELRNTFKDIAKDDKGGEEPEQKSK